MYGARSILRCGCKELEIYRARDKWTYRYVELEIYGDTDIRS